MPTAPTPGGFDYRPAVSGLISQLLHQADGDRYDIAVQVSRLVGRNVSKYMLDAYSSEAREEFNTPLWLLPALETVCGSHDITNWLVGVRGGRMLIGRDSLAADLAQLERGREKINRSIRDLRNRMGSSE